jgi:hypothetical protein
VYPAYQFLGGEVNPVVGEVLSYTWPAFRGWELAIYMHRNYLLKPGRIKGDLTAAGLVREEIDRPCEGQFARVHGNRRRQLEKGEKAYRISKFDPPFHFRSFQGGRIGRENERPEGRYDLPAESGHGTTYVACEAPGAWAEVLGGEPVVLLRHVADLSLWTVWPESSLEVVTVEGEASELRSCPNRAETRAVALRLFEEGARGIRFGLHRVGDQSGLALFGPSECAGWEFPTIGLWSGKSEPGMAGDSFWRYIEEREKGEVGDPLVVLRWFPGDIAFPRWARERNRLVRAGCGLAVARSAGVALGSTRAGRAGQSRRLGVRGVGGAR